MSIHVHTVKIGHPSYERYLGRILDNPEPQIFQDAEIDMRRAVQQDPGKTWWIAADDDGAVLAWCAAWPYLGPGGWQYECGHNYERRGAGRRLGAYPPVFTARQQWIDDNQLTCTTWIFDQPVALHEAAGWRRSKPYDPADVSAAGHHWQLLLYGTP